MEWLEQKRIEIEEPPGSEFLFWSEPQPVGMVLRRAGGYRLLLKPEDASAPMGVVDEADFNLVKCWQFLLSLAPGHTVDLARYSRQNQQLNPEIFLELTGQALNYKNLAEWRELGELGSESCQLARRYNFPLSTLRLFNRFSEAEQQNWRKLWNERNIKRNIIAEIVSYFYELSSDKRVEALDECREFSGNWRARSGVFPGDKLRDIVKERARPNHEKLRRQIETEKKELKLTPRIKLNIPNELESSELTLNISFSDSSELKKELEELLQPERLERLDTIRKLLS